MSLKLSRNKVNCLSSLITEHIENCDELDYLENIGNIRFRIFHLIMDELRLYEQIENHAKEKMKTQKRSVPEGSREWEILYRKYTQEELMRLGTIWD
jgi:hypothetical protein